MYIDKKYFYLQTGEDVSYLGGSPAKFHLDWWKRKANLIRDWRDHNEFYFELGLPFTTITGSFKWGYVERERTEREEERYQRTKKLFEELQKLKPEDIEVS